MAAEKPGTSGDNDPVPSEPGSTPRAKGAVPGLLLPVCVRRHPALRP